MIFRRRIDCSELDLDTDHYQTPVALNRRRFRGRFLSKSEIDLAVYSPSFPHYSVHRP
jgi:hypothetical protein